MNVQSAAVHSGHEEHTEVSWAPIAVAFGVLFLVPGVFVSLLIYHLPLLTIIFAALGVVLVLAGVARWIHEGATQVPVIANVAAPGISVFIVGEILIFLSLFASYWSMRIGAGDDWPPPHTPELNLILPLIMTVILVASSLTYHAGEAAFEKGSKGGFYGWLVISIVLGAAFLGCTTWEYNHLFHEGFVPGTNAYSTAFYSLTGFHGSHVAVGVLAFVAVLLSGLFGQLNKNFVKVAGIYWHFVDIIWFFVATQVYYW